MTSLEHGEANINLGSLDGLVNGSEVQVFGDTAILYYTYIFETGTEGGRSGVDAGRGTEVFVREKGRWLDTGWHLDNGAFQFKDGRWTKMGDQPAPGSGSR